MLLRRIVILLLTLGLAQTAIAAPKSYAWNNAIAIGKEGGIILGNPDAKVKVTQFVSYSCHFCSTFAIQSEGPLRMVYIPTGKVSFEVRPLLLNPIDLAVTMLVQCGSKEKYFLNHTAFLRRQNRWLDKRGGFNPSQTRRWGSGSLIQRNLAIANDLDLYAIMEARGYQRGEVDKCLADRTKAEALQAQSKAASDLGVVGAPTFAINATLLKDTSTWDALRPQIDKSL